MQIQTYQSCSQRTFAVDLCCSPRSPILKRLPPGNEGLPQDELAEMFVDLFQGQCLSDAQPWVISGDFNEEPLDGVLGTLFEAYAGHYVGIIGAQTRWSGNSEIDWLSTNRPQRVLQIDSYDLHVCDHIPLRLKLQLHFDETLPGTLQNFVDYSIPVDLSHLPSGSKIQQHPPKDVEIWYKMIQSRGSHGCDGWEGNELRHLPLGVARAFHAITQRWLKAETVPKQMTQARMISLPKQGKAIHGILPVAQTRPITVFSVWWRIWCMSCLQTTGVQEVAQTKVPSNMCDRKCHSVQQVACHVMEQYCEQGYMLSLDWSKCFDTLAIGPSVKLMKEFGMDSSWCQLCHDD